MEAAPLQQGMQSRHLGTAELEMPLQRRTLQQGFQGGGGQPLWKRNTLCRNPKVSPIPPQLTAQAYTAMQVIGEALARLDRSQPLKGLPLAQARKALMAEILGGTYQTPLGEIRFTPEGEVIQKNFFVAQVRMNAGGKSGRFSLLP